MIGLQDPPKRKKLSAADEAKFQQWYSLWAKKAGIANNPDDPEQKYDYRAAYKAGEAPDEDLHWPSQFKDVDHPNRFVDGMDTRTGKPVGRVSPPREMAQDTRYAPPEAPALPIPHRLRQGGPLTKKSLRQGAFQPGPYGNVSTALTALGFPDPEGSGVKKPGDEATEAGITKELMLGLLGAALDIPEAKGLLKGVVGKVKGAPAAIRQAAHGGREEIASHLKLMSMDPEFARQLGVPFDAEDYIEHRHPAFTQAAVEMKDMPNRSMDTRMTLTEAADELDRGFGVERLSPHKGTLLPPGYPMGRVGPSELTSPVRPAIGNPSLDLAAALSPDELANREELRRFRQPEPIESDLVDFQKRMAENKVHQDAFEQKIRQAELDNVDVLKRAGVDESRERLERARSYDEHDQRNLTGDDPDVSRVRDMPKPLPLALDPQQTPFAKFMGGEFGAALQDLFKRKPKAPKDPNEKGWLYWINKGLEDRQGGTERPRKRSDML